MNEAAYDAIVCSSLEVRSCSGELVSQIMLTNDLKFLDFRNLFEITCFGRSWIFDFAI
jgi:hypothetical protein